MPEYLIIILGILVSTWAIQTRFLIRPLFPTWKKRLVGFGSLWLFGVLWDTYSIVRGHWSYSRDFLICDPPFLGVPVEDYLFCFAVTYLILVVAQVVRGEVEKL